MVHSPDDLTPPHWHDECSDFKPSDVLTLKQALEAAILGYNVRAVDMGEGTYVRYDFAGFRIHHAGGSSSGWSSRPHDETVAWHVIDDERSVETCKSKFDPIEPVGKWGRPTVAPDIQKVGRALRAVPPAPVVVKDWALDPNKKALTVPPPAADKWGRPPNVGNEPKRDSWGRLIPD